MKELTAQKLQEEYRLFLENFPDPMQMDAEVEYFHPFQCPVAVAEAMVKERHVQDYSVLSLLALRLIDIGFNTVEQIVEISGLSHETIVTFLNRAIVDDHCRYIVPEDPESGVRLTTLGKMTLIKNGDDVTLDAADQEALEGLLMDDPEEDEDDSSTKDEAETVSAKAYVLYNAPRKLQIEATTGTLIPAFIELYNRDSSPDEQWDYISPIQTVTMTEQLLAEVHQRIREYIGKDLIQSGDVVENLTSISSVHILFRWAYVTKLKGMSYPVVVMTGRRKVEHLNAQSKKEKNFDLVAVPVAVATGDAEYLFAQAPSLASCLLREDSYFTYLTESIRKFDLTKPSLSDPAEEDETSAEGTTDQDETAADAVVEDGNSQAAVPQTTVEEGEVSV